MMGLAIFALLFFAPLNAAACLGLFSSSNVNEPQTCAFLNDCPSPLVCHRNRCLPPGQIEPQSDAPWPTEPDNPRPAPPIVRLPYDGGPDAVCGADRRCRIERIKSRNRQRRYIEIARQERAVEAEVARILRKETEEIHRLHRPWLIAFQLRGAQNFGLMTGHTFTPHLRIQLDYTFANEYIYYIPDDTSLPAIDGSHFLHNLGAHATYFPSTRWISPFLSAGFLYSVGEFGDFPGPSSSNPNLTYHILTAAIGIETQFRPGFHSAIAIRHGLVLYNQARFAPGSYDRPTGKALREYMHKEGNFSFDFSLGWAF